MDLEAKEVLMDDQEVASATRALVVTGQEVLATKASATRASVVTGQEVLATKASAARVLVVTGQEVSGTKVVLEVENLETDQVVVLVTKVALVTKAVLATKVASATKAVSATKVVSEDGQADLATKEVSDKLPDLVVKHNSHE